MKRLILFPYTFVLMNWAAVAGLYHAVRGTQDIWYRSSHVTRGNDSKDTHRTVAGYYQVVKDTQSEKAAA
jgi:hypothetical protein